MDFGLSEEQELLQRSARELLAAECPPAVVRAATQSASEPTADSTAGSDSAVHPASRSTTNGFPRDLYRKLADLGWFAVLVPETFGGSGGSMLDAALLCEEAGRAALPGPFLATAVLAPIALARGGSVTQRRTWLPRLASGDAVGTVAIVERGDRYDAEGIGARARPARTGYRLSGTKMFVPDAHVADFVVVAARLGARNARAAKTPSAKRRGHPARARNGCPAPDDDGADVSLFLVERGTPGMRIRPLETIDRTRRVSEVVLDDVAVPADALVGPPGAAWPLVRLLLDAGAVALAADSLGGAERVLEMSVEYARVREQFGRPIGSFQAIKHLAAEMVSEIEPARSLVWYAAHAFDTRPRERSRAASIAKARLTDVYARTAVRALQIHGGIGFTWEHDIHWWLKRAKWNEAAFGDGMFHRAQVASIDAF
jgi:alkylation response protein AidB-like acyl-CoA dehydrogenase